MVEDKSLSPFECVQLVKGYFEENLTEFILMQETTHAGYWWVEFSNNLNIRICFDGDIGGHFSIKIYIDGTEYSLWQFDRTVNSLTLSTHKNISAQMGILNEFLKGIK